MTTNAHVDLLRQAKQRFPLPALMATLGHGDHAHKSALCPFHDDHNPSFSVWQRPDGTWRFKCHGSCAIEGDEPAYLAKVRGLSNGDACREYIRMAGVTTPPNLKAGHVVPPPFDWQACVAALIPDDRAELAGWRGYSPAFVEWLHAQGLIGLWKDNQIAFPVHDSRGTVVGCHYRLRDQGSWRFYPVGTRIAPFIVGDLAAARTVLAFESPWDCLAVLDRLEHHLHPLADTAAIATRGASNTRLIEGMVHPDSTVYAFAQNDSPGITWLDAIAARSGAPTFHALAT